MMDRSIPAWFFLLCLLLWALITVAFGWAVMSTLSGSDRTGAVGRAAVHVASFPSLARDALRELLGYTSGEYKDVAISVRREASADYADFEPLPTALDHELPGVLMRANRARMTTGWRLLVGAFRIDDDIENAALLLSPDLEVVRSWILDEKPVNGLEPRPKHLKFVHGVDILRDGSIIFTFDGSISLQRFDACGKRLWATGGNFHHAVTLDEDQQTAWTFVDETITQVAVADGAIVRQITVDDIIRKNPTIDILELHRLHANDLGLNTRNTAGEWLDDPTHFNDVEPLPATFADRFDGFDAGDLLLSARTLNLVFVLDPQSLEVKWWRVGAVQRQHDPDWLGDGRIAILNNRMSRDFSEIVALDPTTMARAVMFDGRSNDFYTRIRGKHQVIENGTLIVTSPQQGRVFEVDAEGNLVFEVANTKPDDANTNYVISELKWLPPDYFSSEAWKCST